MRCQWALYLIIWLAPGFHLVPSLFYQRYFIQVQQEVLTTQPTSPSLTRIWSRAILLSNISRTREFKDFSWLAIALVVAPIIFSKISFFSKVFDSVFCLFLFFFKSCTYLLCYLFKKNIFFQI